jgi:hypothetical protein
VLLPAFRFEIIGVHQGVVRNVDHASPRVPEYLAKRAELLYRTGIVVAKQIAEHLLGREQKFFSSFEVAAWQEQGALKWRARTSCKQDFQVNTVKAEDDKTRGQGNTEVRFFLRKMKHFSHGTKVESRFGMGNISGDRSVKNDDENM